MIQLNKTGILFHIIGAHCALRRGNCVVLFITNIGIGDSQHWGCNQTAWKSGCSIYIYISRTLPF